MPLVKRQDNGGMVFKPQSSTVKQYDSAPKPTLNNVGGIKEKAEEAAAKSNGSFTADDMKYQLAVKTAQNRLADVSDVDDAKLKNEIDNIYENELGATTTGKEHRGENAFTDVIGGIKKFIDEDVNNNIGGAMDWLFDSTIGNLGGDVVKSWFDGKDLSIVPDIAEDVALSLIPYAGIPLVMAKNAIQQSDNIYEAMTGKDSVTMRDLKGSQALGKGAEAALAIGLSSVPGIGKLGKAMKISDELPKMNKAAQEAFVNSAEGAKFLPSTSKGMVKADKKAFKKDVKSAFEDPDATPLNREDFLKYLDTGEAPGIKFTPYKERAKEGWEGFKDSISLKNFSDREALSSAKDIAKENRSKIRSEKGRRSAEYEEADDLFKNASDALSNARPHPLEAIRKLRQGIVPRSKVDQIYRTSEPREKIIERFKHPIKNNELQKAGINAGMNLATMFPAMTLAEMGESGADINTSLANSVGRFAQDPYALVAAMIPYGAKGFAKRQPSMKGRYNNGGGWNYPAVRAAALANRESRMAQEDVYESPDEDTLYQRLLDYLQLDRNE